MDDLFVLVAVKHGFQEIINAGLVKGFQPGNVTKALMEAINCSMLKDSM